jgi:DNA-binding transcriptional LysR family regulator
MRRTSSEALRSGLAQPRSQFAAADLNDLEVFTRVVESAGFSRAARQLGVPASTVSRRVARLEESLGVRLLQRTTRSMNLTDAGREYFERVSLALREIEIAEASVRAVGGAPKGRVRISTISEPFFDGILFDFMDRYAEISLEIDKSPDRVDLVSDGFDLALRTGNLPDSSLIGHRLEQSVPVLCASPEYLKARGQPKSATDLRNHDCVILGSSSSSSNWRLGTAEGSAQKVSVSGRLAVNGLAAAVEGCRRGFGVGLFPELHVRNLLESGALVSFLPELSPPPWALWVVYPSRTLVSPAVRTLLDFIKAAFETEDAG